MKILKIAASQAADYRDQAVPMDRRTALGEAAPFASSPEQAITYHIRKIQLTKLLAYARRIQDDGNVSIALQRWQMPGDNGEVPVAAQAAQ